MKTWDIFLIYDPNIDSGCLLETPKWAGSYKLPEIKFWTKLRKTCIPLQTTLSLYKVGFQGKLIDWTC